MDFEMYKGSAMEVSSMNLLCNDVMTSLGTYYRSLFQNTVLSRIEHGNGQNRTLLHNNRMTSLEDKIDQDANTKY